MLLSALPSPSLLAQSSQKISVNPCVSKEKRLQLSLKAVPRWEHLEQVRAGWAEVGTCAHEIPAGRVFTPYFTPLWNALAVFPGVQRGWKLLLQLLPPWALLSLGSGNFYSNPQMGFILFFLLLIGLQPGKWFLLVFLVKNKPPAQKRKPHKKPEPKQKKPHGPKPQQIFMFNLSLLFKWTWEHPWAAEMDANTN